jgi:hypothetical protein|tara:strand:- start:192 stop:902 length:711 start_codon:yes stop_codon:yes gene_type:complete
MRIFENEDKDVFIEKLEKNKYLLKIPYNKDTKQGSKRKIFWTNFPWRNIKIIKMSSSKEEIRDVVIQSESIQTLSEFLTRRKFNIGYKLALQLFTDIGNQLKTLEQFNIYLGPLDLKDIVVIDEHFFIMEDTKNIAVFSTKLRLQMNQMKMIKKWQQNKFSAPEITNIKSLPVDIPIQSSYYNIASLLVYSLFKKHIDLKKDNTDEILENIKNTKLYWGIKRCLVAQPEERYFLII